MPTFETRHEVLMMFAADTEEDARRMAEEALDQVAFDHSFIEVVK
jgi:hypothetical protein